ncbi:MAG TPA: TonB-dependent receptor [Saprospiraceae bacterium]|nr:TonB-dependent receptor [Saprospiraceae bacterium]
MKRYRDKLLDALDLYEVDGGLGPKGTERSELRNTPTLRAARAYPKFLSLKSSFSLFFLYFIFGFFQIVSAQKADLRGHVYDKNSGEPLAYANVFFLNTNIGTTTDATGFFALAGVPKGSYVLIASYIGYDTARYEITLNANQILNKQIYLTESGVMLNEVAISGKKEIARTEVKISTLTVSPREIKALPSTGGEPDIAQYLQIIPGVVSTGDQGGQIYIRGGSPVQNKILLDGMTIFNPFHSIGIFSVFETEAIRTVDVLTGGFGAEYGGRISAIVDMKTREGNKTKLGGLVSASPFMAKALIEGPLSKFKEGKSGSTSFLLTGKHSYIDQTSPKLYSYALEEGTNSLPFKFTDVYGKISTLSNNGSVLNAFGFRFNDQVNYNDLAKLNWDAIGGGANFKIIPVNSALIIGGNLAYTNYFIQLDEVGSKPRDSRIKGLQANFDFTYFGRRTETKYGIEFNAFSTDFNFINFLKVPININANNTELAGYLKHRISLRKFVLDPSIRIQYYASLAKVTLEPRFGAKWNVSDKFRIKTAGGYFTQNLMSSVSERDIVNLFVGFITSPGLISSLHGVGGFEIDLLDNMDLNVEAYYKKFNSLYNLNRNKRKLSESDYTTETGKAYGIDVLCKTTWPQWNLWLGYSLGYVRRNDGVQTFPALFDRRHNMNVVIDYQFGSRRQWQTGLRWNMGSGFAFTKIQGFFADNKIPNGLNTNFGLDNPDIGVLYSETINSGRLPYYHRLDLSLKRQFKISKEVHFDVIASITNAYNRKNIFYFNVVENRRVNQLPILPSLAVSFHF